MEFFVYMLVLNACMVPYLVQGDGNIDSAPGLTFHPEPPKQDTYENNLIWYKAHDEKNVKFWTNRLDNFLEVYKNSSLLPGAGKNKMTCDDHNPPSAGKVCDVNIDRWSPCTHEYGYAYHHRSPCIFLKLNNVLGWRPEIYNGSLPESMPRDLKHHISSYRNYKDKQLNTLWVSCQGESPVDEENIGPIMYIPRRGFPGYFFPFTDTEGYLSPLVAIHFERPMSGIIINVKCKLWAPNISHDQGQGTLNFELLVD
ncbi:sodium/potassium-transporting ATPase subunit beta-2-like [Hetaerina americana]|uniref:sodium/potassium-transporting ATPase subunit beta-2-like n=1 Tax=Hetaerina americana TaxID=62018 RepID=UPI003A7F2EA2